MNKRDSLRRLKFLLYTHPYVNLTEENIDFCKRAVFNKTYKHDKKYIKYFEDVLEIADLIKRLALSEAEVAKIAYLSRKSKMLNESVYRLKPQKEGRDNKGVYVGNGGSNRNKVRYPKKNRSLRTWKIFYQMFPKKAEQDGWNGKTSNKMK